MDETHLLDALDRAIAELDALRDCLRVGKFADPYQIPKPPDFSAPTHRAYRKKLAEVVALAKAGDVEALEAYPIEPRSSSRKAIHRYRNAAVAALKQGASPPPAFVPTK